jgi:periplasmic protein CpxP/Spy
VNPSKFNKQNFSSRTASKEDGMKRVIGMVLVGLFIAVGSAQAQCGKCGMGDEAKVERQDMVGEKLNQMSKDLKLSAEQRVQVESILKEKMEKKHQIMEQHKAAMEALHGEFKAKLKSVLSEEQMTKWEAQKDKMGDMKGKCPHCKKGEMCEKCKSKKGQKPAEEDAK